MIVNNLVNGILLPIVEELYFRGYILSHSSRFGKKAAILNVSFWDLYHTWAPWTIVGNIIVFAPIAYMVMKERDVRFSIFAHMLANLMLVITIIPLLI